MREVMLLGREGDWRMEWTSSSLCSCVASLSEPRSPGIMSCSVVQANMRLLPIVISRLVPNRVRRVVSNIKLSEEKSNSLRHDTMVENEGCECEVGTSWVGLKKELRLREHAMRERAQAFILILISTPCTLCCTSCNHTMSTAITNSEF